MSISRSVSIKSVIYWQKLLFRLIGVLASLGNVVLMVMLIMLVVDVVLRRVFNSPLSWSMETTKIMLVVVVSFTFSYCALKGGHIQIDILTNKLPPKAQKVIDIIIYLCSIGLYGFMTWCTLIYAMDVWKAHRITGILPVPIAPFIYVLSLGCLLLTLVLFVRLVNIITNVKETR